MSVVGHDDTTEQDGHDTAQVETLGEQVTREE